MKKTFLTSIITLIAVLCILGCTTGSYTFINSNENSESEFWNASYDKFNGYKQREITISGEGDHAFTVEIVTNSGKLGLSIEDDDGKSLYNGNELPSSSFEVIANGEGKYTIRLDADNHNGGFDIKWE